MKKERKCINGPSSIINERKNHSNFQLIIITHDESFLRKLGQSDVMEFYWYVRKVTRYQTCSFAPGACREIVDRNL